MFNDKELRGIFVLVTLVSVTTIALNINKIIPKPLPKPVKEQIDVVQAQDKKITYQPTPTYENHNINHNKSTKQKYKQYKPAKKNIKLHNFDPNTVNKDTLISFGINRYAASNWQKFLNKGGKFIKKNDIKKIYKLTDSEYIKLEPFILLPDSITEKKRKHLPKTKQYQNNKKPVKSDLEKIELNTCSQQQLENLRGIGEVLSLRILKFRDKLGGFYSIEQLKEVYGLSPETYNYIKDKITLDKNKIKKIKINYTDTKALSRSPYLSYKQSKIIANYINQHGYIRDKNEFYKIKALDSNTIKKLLPYIDFSAKE